MVLDDRIFRRRIFIRVTITLTPPSSDNFLRGNMAGCASIVCRKDFFKSPCFDKSTILCNSYKEQRKDDLVHRSDYLAASHCIIVPRNTAGELISPLGDVRKEDLFSFQVGAISGFMSLT